jgi:hypothetical protein
LNYTDYIEYPIDQIVDVPNYDIYTVPLPNHDGVPVANIYIMNQLGSTTDFNSPDLGDDVPTSTLVNDIHDLGSATEYAFWTGAGAWSVIRHVPATGS